jgi:hypothetical protein
MSLRRSNYPLMVNIVDVDPHHPLFGHGMRCYRCGVKTLIINGPHLALGNNIEGVIGFFCSSCSRDYIRSCLPAEAEKYGFLSHDQVEEREKREKEIRDHFVPITEEEWIARQAKNKEEGNLCIVCESEPKKGYEGKYAKDLCEICYDYFSNAYIEGHFDSVEEFKESGIKPGLNLKKCH